MLRCISLFRHVCVRSAFIAPRAHAPLNRCIRRRAAQLGRHFIWAMHLSGLFINIRRNWRGASTMSARFNRLPVVLCRRNAPSCRLRSVRISFCRARSIALLSNSGCSLCSARSVLRRARLRGCTRLFPCGSGALCAALTALYVFLRNMRSPPIIKYVIIIQHISAYVQK